MTCARCGNALHRLPMFDLPRKVKEFSCLCCGERFWTVQGEAKVNDLKRPSPGSEPLKTAAVELAPIAHRN